MNPAIFPQLHLVTKDVVISEADVLLAPIPSVPYLPGELVDQKYELLEHIATGGQAVVWRARHIALDRLVVVRMMREDLAHHPSLALRFVEEGRVLASLENEHIARILDYGRLPSGVPFMVMEYLQGQDLRGFLTTEGPLPIAMAASFVIQACLGIEAAHEKGVVHRDSKPENLFFCSNAKRIKILDFGISKGINPERHQTNPEGPLGTPSYMAPEQLGGAAVVDGRADIWGLGTVLYELLSGVSAFEGSSVTHTCALVLSGEPRALRELRAELPREIEDIVSRCLAKDPTLRYQRVQELASALAPFAGELSERAHSVQAPSASIPELEALDITDIPDEELVAVVPLNTSANFGLWLCIVAIAAVGGTFAALNPDVWWPLASRCALLTEATITHWVQALLTLVEP